MRDALNRILEDCLHITDERRKCLVIYGWLQVGWRSIFMRWIGKKVDFIDLVYLTGIFFHQKKKTANFLKTCIAFSRYFTLAIAQSCLCYIPVQAKLLQMEHLVKQLYLENMRGKRRRISLILIFKHMT